MQHVLASVAPSLPRWFTASVCLWFAEETVQTVACNVAEYLKCLELFRVKSSSSCLPLTFLKQQVPCCGNPMGIGLIVYCFCLSFWNLLLCFLYLPSAQFHMCCFYFGVCRCHFLVLSLMEPLWLQSCCQASYVPRASMPAEPSNRLSLSTRVCILSCWWCKVSLGRVLLNILLLGGKH